ncbi:MAG: MFS transporter, partial [Acidimicrobiales bacterium]
LAPSVAVTVAGSGLVGLGVGSTVVPAFFVVGLSVSSRGLGQVFAIVELLRAVAAFMVAPILLYVATSVAAGTTIALWATFGLAAVGSIVAVGLYVLGGARPVAPVFETWFGGKEPGWDSPPLLARLRRHPSEPNRRVGIESPAPNEPQAVSAALGEPEADLLVSALSGAGTATRRRPDDTDAA